MLRSIEEKELDMVLAVEVPAYEPSHVTDKPWPSLSTKVKRNALKQELERNNLPWKNILTPCLTDDDPKLTYFLAVI